MEKVIIIDVEEGRKPVAVIITPLSSHWNTFIETNSLTEINDYGGVIGRRGGNSDMDRIGPLFHS